MMLNRNDHSPHQGTPMSPTGTMPLVSTGHGYSTDINGYKSAPTSSICPSTLGYRKRCPVTHGSDSLAEALSSSLPIHWA